MGQWTAHVDGPQRIRQSHIRRVLSSSADLVPALDARDRLTDHDVGRRERVHQHLHQSRAATVNDRACPWPGLHAKRRASPPLTKVNGWLNYQTTHFRL